MNLEFHKKIIAVFMASMALLVTLELYSSNLRNSGNQGSAINPPNMTMRLELFTSNIEQTVNFYKNVLGFKSLKSSISTYQPIQNGQVVLGIGLIENLGNDHYFNPNQIDIQYGFGVEIVLEVEDIKFIYNKVKMAHIEIESELKKQPWGLTDFRLVDPNGYYIRVTSKK